MKTRQLKERVRSLEKKREARRPRKLFFEMEQTFESFSLRYSIGKPLTPPVDPDTLAPFEPLDCFFPVFFRTVHCSGRPV